MLRCPRCSRTRCFSVEVTLVKKFYFDAAGDILDSLEVSDTEWSGDSHVVCEECGHEGTVKEFTPVEPCQGCPEPDACIATNACELAGGGGDSA